MDPTPRRLIAFRSDDATRYGVSCAVLLAYFEQRLSDADAGPTVRVSASALANAVLVLSTSQVRRALSKLIDAGAVAATHEGDPVRGRFAQTDRTLSYSLPDLTERLASAGS